MREMLGDWPLLPIAVRCHLEFGSVNNIIAGLEHNERICELGLFDITSRQLEMVLTATHRPFPALISLELACLELRVEDEPSLIDPASFLRTMSAKTPAELYPISGITDTTRTSLCHDIQSSTSNKHPTTCIV